MPWRTGVRRSRAPRRTRLSYRSVPLGRDERRRDRYGGDLVERTRFAVEVVRAVDDADAPDFPVVLRFSQWKIISSLQSASRRPRKWDVSRSACRRRCRCVSRSPRRFWEGEFEGADLNLAGWAKKLSGIPVITVGSVGLDNEFMSSLREGKPAKQVGFDAVVAMIERGDADLVAVGRALLVDLPGRRRFGTAGWMSCCRSRRRR